MGHVAFRVSVRCIEDVLDLDLFSPPSTITHPLKNREKIKETISVQTNETCFKKLLGKKKNEPTGHRYKRRDAAGVFIPVPAFSHSRFASFNGEEERRLNTQNPI